MRVGVAVDRGRIYTDQPVDQVREERCESHGDLATHTLTQERHFRAWFIEILLHKISAKVERHTLKNSLGTGETYQVVMSGVIFGIPVISGIKQMA